MRHFIAREMNYFFEDYSVVENESFLGSYLMRSSAGKSDTYSYIQHTVTGSSLVLHICPKFKDSSSQHCLSQSPLRDACYIFGHVGCQIEAKEFPDMCLP